MFIQCRTIFLLPIFAIFEVWTTEINVSDVLGIFNNFVANFNYPCSVVLTSPVLLSTQQAKAMMQHRPTQILFTDQVSSVDPTSSCVHFIWLKGWEDSVKAVLEKVTQKPGPSYWLGGLGGMDLDGVSIPFHTEFYFLQQLSTALFEFLEVYDVEPGKRVTGRVGTWNSRLGQLSLASQDIWPRRSDLAGKTFRTVMLPFGQFLQVDDNKPETWHGMVPDIFNTLAMRMNFTYTVKFSSDMKWGGKNKVN
jgi:hypothetical protein